VTFKLLAFELNISFNEAKKLLEVFAMRNKEMKYSILSFISGKDINDQFAIKLIANEERKRI